VSELLSLLVPYVAKHGLGRIQVPRAVMVFEGSQVEPDLMVRPAAPRGASLERQPAPRLAVEVLSDSTARRDRTAKRSLYLDAGVAEYWMLDGESKSVTVARRETADLVLTREMRWQPVEGIEPLTFEIAELFR
jgi:Uma2 family endonuclease